MNISPDVQMRIETVVATLIRKYPDGTPLLSYRNCFELLVAVILSAQCTDDQVNRVTPLLFARWPDCATLAVARIEEVEDVVRSTGFYHTKARNIVLTAARILSDFSGQVPDSIDKLVTLPGVGRKTANLVVSACHGKPGIVVDTHVSRVCLRLGFSPDRNPLRIERILAAGLPPERWTAVSHALNRLGKFVCASRHPRCGECPVNAECPSSFSIP